MEFTNKEIFDSYLDLAAFAERDLPMKLAYAVAKSIRSLKKEFETIGDLRLKIAKKFGKMDKEGKLVTTANGGIEIDDVDKADEELTVLMAEVVDVSIHEIQTSKFKKDFVSSPAELTALIAFGILIEDDE